MFASTQAGLRAALLVMSLALAPADVLSQNRPTDAIALAGGTRLAMDSAARQGRFAELARWFSPDAVLVIGADTVVGRAAVLEQIMARTSGALQALTSFILPK